MSKFIVPVVVAVKNIYGNDLIYPLSHTEALRTLTKQKTLTKQQINALRSLGVEVTQSQAVAV